MVKIVYFSFLLEKVIEFQQNLKINIITIIQKSQTSSDNGRIRTLLG